MYRYAVESLRTLSGEKNYNGQDEDEEFTSGIGLMTDKPFSNGREYVDSGFVHDLTDTVRRTIITTLQHMCGPL